MKKSSRNVLIVAVGVFVCLIILLGVILSRRGEFSVSVPRSCSWMRMPFNMSFDSAAKDEQLADTIVTVYDSLVFRQLPLSPNQYVFAALSTTSSESGKIIYASPKYRFSTSHQGPAQIASDQEWMNAKTIDTGFSFDELVRTSPQLRGKRDALNTIEKQATGQTVYAPGSELFSTDLKYVALPSRREWYSAQVILLSTEYGLAYWDVFDFETQKRIFTTSSIFLSMARSDAKGQAYWLPGGVLVIRPPLGSKRLLVCKTQ